MHSNCAWYIRKPLKRQSQPQQTTKFAKSFPIFEKNKIWASAWDFQQCDMCKQQSLRSACAWAQSDQSLCCWLEYSMIVKLLTEHHLECLSLEEGCRGYTCQNVKSSEISCRGSYDISWESSASRRFSRNIMPYLLFLLFLKKQQNLKLSSAANYRWRFKGKACNVIQLPWPTYCTPVTLTQGMCDTVFRKFLRYFFLARCTEALK